MAKRAKKLRYDFKATDYFKQQLEFSEWCHADRYEEHLALTSLYHLLRESSSGPRHHWNMLQDRLEDVVGCSTDKT